MRSRNFFIRRLPRTAHGAQRTAHGAQHTAHDARSAPRTAPTNTRSAAASTATPRIMQYSRTQKLKEMQAAWFVLENQSTDDVGSFLGSDDDADDEEPVATTEAEKKFIKAIKTPQNRNAAFTTDLAEFNEAADEMAERIKKVAPVLGVDIKYDQMDENKPQLVFCRREYGQMKNYRICEIQPVKSKLQELLNDGLSTPQFNTEGDFKNTKGRNLVFQRTRELLNWTQLPKLSTIPKRYVTKHKTYDWEMWLHDTTKTNQIPDGSKPYPKPNIPRIANFQLWKKGEKHAGKDTGCQRSYNVFKGQTAKVANQITMEFLNYELPEGQLRCVPKTRCETKYSRGLYKAQIDNPAGTTGKKPRHPPIPLLPFENLHADCSMFAKYNPVENGNMGERTRTGHLKHNYLEVALEQIVEDFASVIISDGEIPSWNNDEADIDFIRGLRQKVQDLDAAEILKLQEEKDIEAIVPGWTINWDRKRAKEAAAKAKKAMEYRRKRQREKEIAAARAAKRGAL